MGVETAPLLGSRADAADWLGISRQALEKNAEVIIEFGGKVDLKATVRAYAAHVRGVASGRGGADQVGDLTRERARLAKQQADAKEIQNDIQRGELVLAAEVENTWATFLRNIRSQLLALPSRVQAAAALTKDQVAAVDVEVRAVLSEMAEDAGGA